MRMWIELQRVRHHDQLHRPTLSPGIDFKPARREGERHTLNSDGRYAPLSLSHTHTQSHQSGKIYEIVKYWFI